MSFIDLKCVKVSLDARAHEALHKLPLKQQEGDKQRRRRHQCRSGDDGQESMPWSVLENTCSPTVRGRAFTLLVMMTGHKKLFQ